ncbi:DMT family transporter [Salinibius halmophilus]|uniref:DMT family transporter n=1 Tax=Salinibius halmophilus TaxID=1853216 RepID=UPI000E663C6C|nr:DMT family transporter [Salinibius halmophilus]
MGIAVALMAAFFWALSARFYGHSAQQWSVILLNLTKNLVAVVALALLMLAIPGSASVEGLTLVVLIISGFIGIGIGDTALFAALKRMGEQNTLLLAETMAPIVVIALGWLFLSETLSLLHYVGIVLVILATDIAIGWRKSQSLDLTGVALTLVAAACQATGALISRYYLTSTDLPVLDSAMWRLLGGLIFALLALLAMTLAGRKVRWQTLNVQQSSKLFTAILLGTVLGVFMLQWSLDLLPAGLAQTLLATSPLFAILIALALGLKPTKRQVVALALGLVGVAVIAFA